MRKKICRIKRGLAVMLSVCMVFGVAPIQAGAEENDSEIAVQANDSAGKTEQQSTEEEECKHEGVEITFNSNGFGNCPKCNATVYQPAVETTDKYDIDDDSMKERVYIAPSKYSVAGPEDAYRYWVKTYNSSISDVLVKSDNPVEVIIEFIMENGELPTEGIIQGLQIYLADEQIRPLTDKVTVKAPDTVDYKLDVKYYINSSDLKRADTIKANVAAAVEQYIIWQRSKIGRDINPSQLIQMMVSAGAKRVEVKLPVFQVIGATNVAKLVSQTVTYGGIEDD